MARLPSVTSKRTASWSPRCKRAGLDKSAKPDAAAGLYVLLHHVGRRIEEHDGILQRAQHQHGGERQHAEAAADQNETPLLACHALAFEPQSLDRFVQTPQAVGIAFQRAPRVAGRCARLLLVAEHHIGAQKPQPAIDGSSPIAPLSFMPTVPLAAKK